MQSLLLQYLQKENDIKSTSKRYFNARSVKLLQTVLAMSFFTPIWTKLNVRCASPDYPHGITILSPFGSDKKQVLTFCAQSAEELLKFVEDLKESISEVSEMEQIRIECKSL